MSKTTVEAVKRKKGPYSKAGCKECRRRKVKCDESKPICWQCDRLQKECVYEIRHNSLTSSYGINKSSPANTNGTFSQYGLPSPRFLVQSAGTTPSIQSNESSPSAHTLVVENNVIGDDVVISNNPVNDNVITGNGLDKSAHSTIPPNQPDTYQFFDESLLNDEDWISHAGLLATNLNDLVSMKLGESSRNLPTRQASSKQTDFFQPKPELESTTHYTTEIRHNVPLDYIKLSRPHKLYLEEFYYGFSKIILPFTAYNNGVDLNPVRDVLLTYAARERYLLLALLACGARSSHKKTTLSEDEQAYCDYLASCIESLETIFTSETNLVPRIETILLTVLVLTSDHASSNNQDRNWRAHLQGAKELLLKYASQSRPSHVLVLCKAWYSSIEILAALGAPNGGTLTSDEELDLLISPDNPSETESLIQLSLCRRDGFNLFHGYSNQLIVLIRDIIKLLRKTKLGTFNMSPPESDTSSITSEQHSTAPVPYREVLRLLSGLNNQLDYRVADKTSTTTGLSPDSVETITINNVPTSFCWFDISHQSYTLAALVTIFTKLQGLPKTAPIVQQTVKEIISLMVFLDGPNKSYNTFLLQWPMLVAGSNAVHDEDIAKVEKFFRLLAELGAGSAGLVLKKMRKTWGMRDEPGESTGSGDDDEKDIVTY